MPKNLPVLLISGSEDPVGNYGRGVREVYDKLIKNGQKDVSLRLYENKKVIVSLFCLSLHNY